MFIPLNFFDTPPTPDPTGGVKSSYTCTYPDRVYAILSYRRLLQYSLNYYSRVCIEKHSFCILGRPHPSPRNPPVTVIKMVHISIASFHINLYANKSYLIDVEPPETH